LESRNRKVEERTQNQEEKRKGKALNHLDMGKCRDHKTGFKRENYAERRAKFGQK